MATRDEFRDVYFALRGLVDPLSVTQLTTTHLLSLDLAAFRKSFEGKVGELDEAPLRRVFGKMQDGGVEVEELLNDLKRFVQLTGEGDKEQLLPLAQSIHQRLLKIQTFARKEARPTKPKAFEKTAEDQVKVTEPVAEKAKAKQAKGPPPALTRSQMTELCLVETARSQIMTTFARAKKSTGLYKQTEQILRSMSDGLDLFMHLPQNNPEVIRARALVAASLVKVLHPVYCIKAITPLVLKARELLHICSKRWPSDLEVQRSLKGTVNALVSVALRTRKNDPDLTDEQWAVIKEVAEEGCQLLLSSGQSHHQGSKCPNVECKHETDLNLLRAYEALAQYFKCHKRDASAAAEVWKQALLNTEEPPAESTFYVSTLDTRFRHLHELIHFYEEKNDWEHALENTEQAAVCASKLFAVRPDKKSRDSWSEAQVHLKMELEKREHQLVVLFRTVSVTKKLEGKAGTLAEFRRELDKVRGRRKEVLEAAPLPEEEEEYEVA